ncbi:MAG: hypothetical protein QOH41_3947 [Blastocatellia bacterium]|jgi:hypothetical protein|nr:hypothetical protein [Blastocatellia bacterium]
MPAKKASKKTASKKSAKKATKAGFPPPPINLQCLRGCFDQHLICLRKGVDPALCMKRYIRCVENCLRPK